MDHRLHPRCHVRIGEVAPQHGCSDHEAAGRWHDPLIQIFRTQSQMFTNRSVEWLKIGSIVVADGSARVRCINPRSLSSTNFLRVHRLNALITVSIQITSAHRVNRSPLSDLRFESSDFLDVAPTARRRMSVSPRSFRSNHETCFLLFLFSSVFFFSFFEDRTATKH